jgi:hypothetical protein
VAGYDRDTEVLAVEYDLDPTTYKKVKKVVVPDAGDPDLVGSYPLSNGQLRAITDITGVKFDNNRYEFFLEPA